MAPESIALAAALGLLLAACGGSRGYSRGGEVYTVRGEVERLPTPSDRELWIHHEAVPTLRGISGKQVGMESMSMPFDLGPGELPPRLAVGDKVRFELHVDWHAETHPVWVGGIERLPPETELSWEASAGSGETPR
jgi:hypothetical protein